MDVPVKPGKVQAIAIMTLIGGIFGVLVGIWMALGTVFMYCPWVYSLVMGVMAIIKGAKLLGRDAYRARNSKGVAIMQIINIINCDVTNLVLGILCLVFASDEEVAGYFADPHGRG